MFWVFIAGLIGGRVLSRCGPIFLIILFIAIMVIVGILNARLDALIRGIWPF